MSVSFLVAIYFHSIHERIFGFTFESHYELVLSVFITTLSWILVTLLTKPTENSRLFEFYKKIKPYDYYNSKSTQSIKAYDKWNYFAKNFLSFLNSAIE